MKLLQIISFLQLDKRILALFRIVLGISWLYNMVWYKLPSIELFWGNNAIPPFQIFKSIEGIQSFSFFDIFQSTTFAYFIFYSTIFLLILFTIGFKSKITGWISYFLLFNIHQRISPIIFGFDFFSLHLLFFAGFLPLDYYLSITRNKTTPPKKNIEILASFAILLQIVFIYFCTGIAKYGDSWRFGYAVQNMLSDKMLAYSWASTIANNKLICSFLTYLTLLIEYTLPLLVFIPFQQKYLRLFASISIFLFHLSIFLLYDVANFSISGMAVAVLLFPPEFLPDIFVEKKWTSISHLVNFTKKEIILLTSLSLFILLVSIQSVNFACKHNYTVKDDQKENLIDKLKFGKAFITTQYWKMFAPNPPSRIGWITIEYLKDDSLMYDFFTDDIITNKAIRNYKPIGMEKMFLSYARFWEARQKFQLYLSYWVSYHLANQKIPTNQYNKYFLANYNYVLVNNEIKYKKQLLMVSKILQNENKN